MTKPVVQTWGLPNPTAIASLQTSAVAGSLSISNGSMNGNYRTVSLTSVNNLSGVNFTITGTLMGNIVSQTIAGPNNDTVYTTQLFDSVTSISFNAAVTAVSAGTGTTGQTAWIPYSYNTNVLGSGIQVKAFGTAGNITYNLATTFDDVTKTSSPAVTTGAIVPNPTNVTGATAGATWMTIMAGAAATNYNDAAIVASDFYPKVWAFACIKITAASANTVGLVSTFIQQGAN